MTPDQRAAFLDSLAAGVDMPRAMRHAGIRDRALKAAREADPELDLACLAAERRALPSGWAAAVAASERATVAEPPATADDPPRAEPGALDLDVIREEARQLAPGPFGYFLWLERRLVAAGFPPVSEWWRDTLRDFYASGKRWLVVMAGRGAGKSTMLTRVAVAEALFTERTAPPGETWVWPFVSVATADARRRILQIAAILGALGIVVKPSYPQGHPTIETVDLRGNPIAFVAFASTIAALSGPTSIGGTVDEEAKLRGLFGDAYADYARRVRRWL